MLRILRRPEVEAATGLGRTRIYDLEHEGRFPKRIRISDRAVGWRSDLIEAWIKARPLAEDVPTDGGTGIDARNRGVAA